MSKVNFLNTFNNVSVEIPFNPEWKNMTGYFDYAVSGKDMPIIPTGMTVKSVDEKGRKIIITSITGPNGTQVSNVVIFERYSDPEETIIVSNATREMRLKYPFLSNGVISEEDFRVFHNR